MAHAWGYTKKNGPHTWEISKGASGKHQSPVNIETSKTQHNAYKPLQIRYEPKCSTTLHNSGHSVQVDINDQKDSNLQGGPLSNAYRAKQFHFHWGKTSSQGSEHLVDGKAYSAELHIVHWNTELYPTFEKAAESANGLAVVGVFLKCGAEHPSLKKLTNLFKSIPFKGKKTEITGGFDPASLLPSDKTKYWTYSGSLTTPPCHESVQFIILKEPIEVSEEQLNAFRELYSGENQQCNAGDEFGGKIALNYRPAQPLNDRTIYRSFK